MGIIGFIKVSFGLFLFVSCQSNTVHTETNLNLTQDSLFVDLQNRYIFSLPAQLDEISGHIFLPTDDNIVYGVQDERGVIYAYALDKKVIVDSIPFAKKGDFEGITTDGYHFYVLKSNGAIYSVPVNNNLKQEVKVFKEVIGKNEYESLGIDTANRQLVILCKDCKSDKKNHHSTGYLLNYSDSGQISMDKSFVVDWNDLSKYTSKPITSFKPSAISKNPVTGDWYILSSINKVLVITNSDFNTKAIIPFSRKDYEQPEGIAFDSKGNLYISSEIGDTDSAKLYKIK